MLYILEHHSYHFWKLSLLTLVSWNLTYQLPIYHKLRIVFTFFSVEELNDLMLPSPVCYQVMIMQIIVEIWMTKWSIWAVCVCVCLLLCVYFCFACLYFGEFSFDVSKSLTKSLCSSRAPSTWALTHTVHNEQEKEANTHTHTHTKFPSASY